MNNAGKVPKWNETINVQVKYIGDDFTIDVLDEDLTSSDLVGSCSIKISALCVNGGISEWFDLQYKGKKAGTIHLKGDWKPDVAQETKLNYNAQAAG